jgi:hypothetical protein
VKYEVTVASDQTIDEDYFQNPDFAEELTQSAVDQGIIGQNAVVVNDDIKAITITMQPTALPTPNPTSVMAGDPHLVGFQGQRFDVIGKAGSLYNLVTDDYVHMAVQIDEPFFIGSMDQNLTSGHKGLYMSSVSVAFTDGHGDTHELIASGDFESTVPGDRFCSAKQALADECLRGLRLTVDGGRLDAQAPGSWMIGKDAELHIMNSDCPFENREGPCLPFHRQLGGYAQMKLKVPSFTLEVGAQFMNYHALEMRALHHLDLAIGAYRPSRAAVGGILGQTVAIKMDANGQPIMKGTDCYSGSEDDYIVGDWMLDVSTLKAEVPVLAEGSSFLSSYVDGSSA